MSPAPAFRCRGCDNPHLTLVLPLGPMPLANALPAAQETAEEARHPLDVAFCPECTLVQITETVPPETLFREYLYFSSFSDAMVRHGRDIARRLANVRQLGPSHLVVEIASNDGYLLQHFVAMNVPVLGIEPAANIAQVARDRGVRTMAEFFGSALADRLRSEGVRADVILANNVIAHIPDINGAMAGIKTLLHDDGVFVMETPYIKDLVDHLEFDTIYHEHLFYYSLTALERLFRRHGLAAASVERIPIHGGSLRVSVTHEGAEVDRESVAALLDEEAAWGVADERFYSDFAVRVAGLKRSLRMLLEDLKRQGKRVAAYGAAAKGSTLLNASGIDRELLEFVVDRSTYKQGRRMPGIGLPIYAPEKLVEEMPDYVLLLTWNFADEILAQQAEYQQRGGRFIVPIPEPRILA